MRKKQTPKAKTIQGYTGKTFFSISCRKKEAIYYVDSMR